MGSLERGVLTGFICRLCSDMHRVVLHIYGDEGIRMCISEKINRHLSINVSFFFKLSTFGNTFNNSLLNRCLQYLLL